MAALGRIMLLRRRGLSVRIRRKLGRGLEARNVRYGGRRRREARIVAWFRSSRKMGRSVGSFDVGGRRRGHGRPACRAPFGLATSPGLFGTVCLALVAAG